METYFFVDSCLFSLSWYLTFYIFPEITGQRSHQYSNVWVLILHFQLSFTLTFYIILTSDIILKRNIDKQWKWISNRLLGQLHNLIHCILVSWSSYSQHRAQPWYLVYTILAQNTLFKEQTEANYITTLAILYIHTFFSFYPFFFSLSQFVFFLNSFFPIHKSVVLFLF